MIPLHVFVNYAYKQLETQEKELAIALLDDLKNAGVEVTSDSEHLTEAEYLLLLQQELPRSQWFILIQSAEAMRSLRTQVAMNFAIQQMKLHTLQGIIRIVCPSAMSYPIPPQWPANSVYVYTGDYPRLREKILLELNVLRIENKAMGPISEIATTRLSQADITILPDKAPPLTPEQMFTPFTPVNRSDTLVVNDQPTHLPVPAFVPPFLARLWHKKPESQVTLVDRPPALPRRSGLSPLWRILLLIVLILAIIAGGSAFFLRNVQLAPTVRTTPTPTLSSIPYPPYKGVLVLNDPLNDSSAGYNWGPGYVDTKAYGTSCSYINNTYHVLEINKGRVFYCIEKKVPVRNFAFQVEMVIVKGDFGGMLFRLQDHTYYFFRTGVDGAYFLKVFTDSTTGAGHVLAQGKSPAINAGLQQHNTLAVVARNSNFELYVNNTLVATAYDNSYTQGLVGIVAEAEEGPTEVAFSNAKIWSL